MTPQKIARLVVMLLGWGATGAIVAYGLGVRRADFIWVSAIMTIAGYIAVSALLFLVASSRSKRD